MRLFATAGHEWRRPLSLEADQTIRGVEFQRGVLIHEHSGDRLDVLAVLNVAKPDQPNLTEKGMACVISNETDHSPGTFIKGYVGQECVAGQLVLDEMAFSGLRKYIARKKVAFYVQDILKSTSAFSAGKTTRNTLQTS